jgi:DNA-binding transcriptional ArsR family regulator
VSDDVSAVEGRVEAPEQFKALAHPMRHRLLFALGEHQATVSQLSAELGSNKGNIAHHLKVLADAGLVAVAQTRRVRGGTEKYYRRTAGMLRYSDEHATATAFRAIADEIATAEPDPFLALRNVRLTADQAARITDVLRELADNTPDAGPDQPRYGLLLGLYRPGAPKPDDRRQPG